MSASRKPCILLLSPGIIKWTDMDFGLPHLVSIGGYLVQHLNRAARVEILDLGYEGGDHAKLSRTLASLEPFLCIGVSCFSSFDALRVLTLARFLRSSYPGVPLVTGGYHASAVPDELLGEGGLFDAVVVGEGERPMLEVVRELLGGAARPSRRRFGPDAVPDLDSLPPYRWELLRRYWPRATDIGRKLQVYLSRGCPYHCTFCMERAKAEYRWRAYSPERAVAELRRLASFTDLGRWVVNLADPLFGFRRSWRREVLEGIVRQGLLPRQYWTLTRSDDLEAEDIALLARARFSIGIGLESGSPRMLEIMQKTRDPGHYLDAVRRLATLSRDHGLNWATNIIVGHPGETAETLEETRRFVWELFTSARETCGWLSVDPFRLYPGSYVHESMREYEERYGTRFYHERWWRSWYDGSFHAEHVDPSAGFDYESRVTKTYEAFSPVVAEIGRRFRGQGRSIDRVFRQSLAEQTRILGDDNRDALLARARQSKTRPPQAGADLALSMPIGLHVRDARVRRREEAVRRLLERGTLRTEALVEALLLVPPERYLGDAESESMIRDARPETAREGEPPRFLGIATIATALEALEPGAGDRVSERAAASGYVAALLAKLVAPEGSVHVVSPGGWLAVRRLRAALRDLPGVQVVAGDGTAPPAAGEAPFDRIFFGGALPAAPSWLLAALADPGGRAVAFVGPRFRAQDLVCLTRNGDRLDERAVARARVPVLAGREGWLREVAR